MRLLIVEDDYLQSEWLREALRERFPQTELELEIIKTEHEFVTRLERFQGDFPDLVVMDVMLPWTGSANERPQPPPEVKTEGFYRAGLRCVRRLRQKEETRHLPVILYSILQEADIEKEIENLGRTQYIRKDSAPEVLLEAIERLAGGSEGP